jgi:hypothetical protein
VSSRYPTQAELGWGTRFRAEVSSRHPTQAELGWGTRFVLR